MGVDARFLLVVTVVVLAVAITGSVSAAAPSASADAPGILADEDVHECAATPPPDHADPDGETSEVIGWVDGYWYDEPIDFDTADSLTEEDIKQLAARTAARVEAIRCLTFDELPSIEFMTRDEYRDDLVNAFDEISDSEWRFEDARLATLVYAGQDESAADVHLAFRTAFPAAFYNIEEESMGFIVDDPDDIEVNQVTLAHELAHALQDQHFDLMSLIDAETSDEAMVGRAIAEGDAVAIDTAYERNCDLGTWVDACLIPPPGDPPTIEFWGLTIEALAAYQTPLVAETAQVDGWDGVNELFDEPPVTMAEAINPANLGDFDLADLTVPDESDMTWTRITDANGEPHADRIGQHGLTAMLAAITYETDFTVSVIDMSAFLSGHAGGDLTYEVPETSGWIGDRLYAYEREDGELASVWKLAWIDETEATRFADAYTDLLTGYGGEPVDRAPHVIDLHSLDGYEMVTAVSVQDDRVWIVTAPTVDDLTAVHATIDLGDADTPVPTPTPTPTPTPPTTADTIPALGVTGVVLVLLSTGFGLYLIARRR